MNILSDKELIINYFKGDKSSLEFLIQRYLKMVYSFVYYYVHNKQDAEDLTQETFIKTWKKLKRFDQNKNFKNWIISVAKNTCIDHLRKKRFITFSFIEQERGNLLEKIIDTSSDSNKLIDRLDAQQRLVPAIKKLSPKYQLVLSFYYKDQMNFREIAATLNESLNTIKSRYRRAIIILRKSIIKA